MHSHILSRLFTLSLCLQAISCRPLASKSPTSSLQVDHNPLLAINGNQRLNATSSNTYDITWPVGRTTMTLKIATEPEGYLPDSEVIALLRSVTRAAYAHPGDTPLMKPIWFRDLSKKDGAWFTISPPPLHRELTWKSVYKVAEALLEFYRTKEEHLWPQLDFLIDDPKQGTVGTGVLRRSLMGGGAHLK